MSRYLTGRAAPEVDNLVHLCPIDGQGQGYPEAPVPIQCPQLLILVVIVELNDHIARMEPVPYMNLDGTRSLPQLQQGNVLGPQFIGGKVELPGRSHGCDDFLVFDDLGLDSIDVGQLVALGIDLEVIGIALIPGQGGRAIDHPVSMERRSINAFLNQAAPAGVYKSHPADVAHLLYPVAQHLPLDVTRVEAAIVMLRHDKEVTVLGEGVDK